MYQRNTPGFTIIELMLAMSFVSILLISVAMLTIQIGHLYSRGVTMKEINQAGTEISDDLRRSIAESYTKDIKSKVANGKTILCTGIYTYIANDPVEIENNVAGLLKYNDNSTVVRLAKVRDIGGTYCTSLPPRLPDSNATEMLGGDRSLVVRKLDIATSSVSDLEQGLYHITLTLSSGTTSELEDSGSRCRTPDDVESGGEYCTIDTFDIVARTGNTYGN